MPEPLCPMPEHLEHHLRVVCHLKAKGIFSASQGDGRADERLPGHACEDLLKSACIEPQEGGCVGIIGQGRALHPIAHTKTSPSTVWMHTAFRAAQGQAA